MSNRLMTIVGAANALGESRAKVRAMVLAQKIPAWVYNEKGLQLIRYRKMANARHPIIYIYEDSLQTVCTLPPLRELPPGKLVSKKGAATLLGCREHWLHERAESGKIRAWVYDQWGVNLISLEDRKKEDEEQGIKASKNARVLHFLVPDILLYKKKIAEYQKQPLMKRSKPNLSAELKQRAIALALKQMEEQHYVAMAKIREALGLANQYDDALRRLREEYSWPMKNERASLSRKKQG